MGVPLRGEITRPAGLTRTQPMIDHSLDNIHGLLSQFIRLSRQPSQVPTVTVSQHLADGSHGAAAPWSWTAAEVASAEAVLTPFLVHTAAAKDDLESMTFCLTGSKTLLPPERHPQQQWGASGGIVNCLDPASGRSPLHVAALNGSSRCVNVLLKSGASVHLRDSLGHTALYYASILPLLPIFFLTDGCIVVAGRATGPREYCGRSHPGRCEFGRL
jgi:60kDa lysophospholipase